VGWKGTVRSIGSAYRAAQRQSQQRQRELERQRKQYQKMQELEQAAYEVEVFENRIQVLLSVHKECGDYVDWQAMALAQPPSKPCLFRKSEKQAQEALDNFRPGIFVRALGRVEKKKTSLVSALEEAKKIDENNYRQALKSYEEEHNDWQKSKELAQRVLSNDKEALIEAIRELNPFSDIGELGSSLSFEINDEDRSIVDATLHVHGDEAIPKETKSLLKSGRLSVKVTPKAKFFELYQDYVCSCIIRVANELFAILPVNFVIVTALDKLLNTKTGHMEETPILSVAIPKKTIVSLNLDSIDPSDSLENFLHRMDFKKTKGFGAIERIRPSELQEN
jgi:tetratricopeptide (TPR) repeat protein